MKTSLTELELSREQQIAELAEFIAEDYGTGGRVEPASIARKKNITHNFGYYKNAFDGMLEFYDKRFHIYLNLSRLERYESPRARFTFAHELGHYFIDEHRNALQSGFAPAHFSVCEYESDNLVEREADWFASNLLMPQTRFLRKAQESQVGMKGVLEIQRYFNTSITSAMLRYAQSGVAPCVVMKWNANGLAWKKQSGHEVIQAFRRPVEYPQYLPENSPTLWALRGAKTPAHGFFAAHAKAESWFPNLKDASLRDAVFIEQAIRLGQFGVLTLLYLAD
jgi:Zn-dependent peptidase ImmA (M78 family)